MSKQMELSEINRYIGEYVKRWEAGKEKWVKLMIWRLMIKRSRIKVYGGVK